MCVHAGIKRVQLPMLDAAEYLARAARLNRFGFGEMNAALRTLHHLLDGR